MDFDYKIESKLNNVAMRGEHKGYSYRVEKLESMKNRKKPQFVGTCYALGVETQIHPTPQQAEVAVKSEMDSALMGDF